MANKIDEDKRISFDITSNFKRLLLACDLEIARTMNEMTYYNAQMQKFKNSKSITRQRKYANASANYAKASVYLQQLQDVQEQVNKDIDDILKKYYSPLKRKVWRMKFLLGMSLEDISKVTHYSVGGLAKMITFMRKDLLIYAQSEIGQAYLTRSMLRCGNIEEDKDE